MLSFIEQDANMAQRLFDLSQSACDVTAGSLSVAERNARAKGDTSWPFFCVGILFTKEALQALRRGVLNDKCMKHQTIFGILNTFHRACFAEFERYENSSFYTLSYSIYCVFVYHLATCVLFKYANIFLYYSNRCLYICYVYNILIFLL